MKQFFGRILKILTIIQSRNIPLHAANAGYFIVLALFPALVLLMSMLRYLPVDIYAAVTMLDGILPAALIPAAERLILNIYNSASGAVISLSAATALWSASRGIYGLLVGLNAVYDVSEDRGYFYTRFISVVYTFLFLIVLLLTLVLHVFGTSLLDLIASAQNPIVQFLTRVIDLRFFLLVFIQTLLFTAIFMVFPNRRNRFSDSLPGALFASIGWLVFSHLYSIYVEHFPSYANIYGSVYAVALSMLWLYCCLTIVFYGGLLNAAILPKKEN